VTLLTLVQAASRQLSAPIPSTVAGATDETTLLLLRLAQEEGESLMRRYAWTRLTREHTFTTVAADVQVSSLPADLDRIIPETIFNRTTRRRVMGPISVEEWQSTKSSLVTYVNPAFRIRENAILITPQPPAGETVAYEYISKTWCESATGTAQDAWLADADVARLDERLMILGLVWRFKQQKGMAYGDDMAFYERRVTDAMLRDGVKERIQTDMMMRDRLPSAPQTPETLVF
jgi:hypothetical protein